MNHLYQGGLRSVLLCWRTPQIVSFRLARWQRALWSFALVLLVSCAESTDHPASVVVTPSPISTEQQRLEDFFTATWEEDLARYPASASYLGIKDRQDQWNDVSESFQLESLETIRQRLAFLEGIDTAQLSPERQLSYRLYRLDLERTLAGERFRHHRYVIHQFRGPHTSPISVPIPGNRSKTAVTGASADAAALTE